MRYCISCSETEATRLARGVFHTVKTISQLRGPVNLPDNPLTGQSSTTKVVENNFGQEHQVVQTEAYSMTGTKIFQEKRGKKRSKSVTNLRKIPERRRQLGLLNESDAGIDRDNGENHPVPDKFLERGRDQHCRKKDADNLLPGSASRSLWTSPAERLCRISRIKFGSCHL
ncbi:MAG: hypothetical protein BWY42_00696 [Candidatus Omnitrophica bacterium ADurb.Bin277]|nr:MAG: hypothetical protein BWY42_00696 [Candidatus Omnitrophica bacterium ADurb.Bin277]